METSDEEIVKLSLGLWFRKAIFPCVVAVSVCGWKIERFRSYRLISKDEFLEVIFLDYTLKKLEAFYFPFTFHFSLPVPASSSPLRSLPHPSKRGKQNFWKGYFLFCPEAIGVTNQRETTVVWDKTTGEPLYNAIGNYAFCICNIIIWSCWGKNAIVISCANLIVA